MTDLRALDENLASHLATCDLAELVVHLHALARELDARGQTRPAELITHAHERLTKQVRWHGRRPS